MPLEFKGAQPPQIAQKIVVHRVTTCESQLFIVLSNVPYGQWIHWFGNRSHECKADYADCKGCHDSWPRKFKAYLHCLEGTQRTPCFLELTLHAVKAIELQMDKRPDWRGSIMSVRKSKGGKQGRYIIDVKERTIDPQDLPQAADPLETLRFLWRCNKGKNCPTT